MWRNQYHQWNRHPYHFHHGHRHFNPLMLLFPLLFLVFFGGFILKFLLWIAPFLLVLWLVSKVVRGIGGCQTNHHYDGGDKLKNDEYDDEKPKRKYVETSDGQWVEII